MILSISFIFLFAMTASANLITNGSFEEGAYDDAGHPGYMRLSGGSTTITGWIVGQDGLDWHIIEGSNAHFGHNGVDGSQYAVDLSSDGGFGNYSISQSFATTIGQEYQLTFLLGAPLFATGVTVSISDISQNYYLLPQSQYDFAWDSNELIFTAIDSLTTLTFSNISGGFWTPVIDNVSVEAVEASTSVPEPATFLLFGIGLLGLAGASRKKQHSLYR